MSRTPPTRRMILEDAQKLGLEQWRELADLVEKQRAAVGHLEQPLLHGLGVGEGALLMAEQFGLHQGFGNGGTVDGYKGPLAAGAVVVDGLGDQVFAGATFSLNQNCSGFAGGNLVNELHQFRDLPGDPDHVVIARAPPHLPAERFDLRAQGARLQGILERDV